jgi:hypothetical protein
MERTEMTADEYLKKVLEKHRVIVGPLSLAEKAAREIAFLFERDFDPAPVATEISGSYAKGTAVRHNTDIDLLLSFTSSLKEPVAQLSFRVSQFLNGNRIPCSRKGVAWCIHWGLVSVDIVPARRQDAHSQDLTLHHWRVGGWTKTNITKQISFVKNSGRLDEIKLMKIWRNQKQLELPSVCLELAVIEALKGKHRGELVNNFIAVLQYLAENARTMRLVDPGNPSNVVTDSLGWQKRNSISVVANQALVSAQLSLASVISLHG